MAPVSPGSTCLISLGHDGVANTWKDEFKEYIAEVGLRAADYSVAAVDGASCLLALPRGQESVVYHMAYALGRGLEVLAIAEEVSDLDNLQPAPTKVVAIQFSDPCATSKARKCITEALNDFLASSGTDIPPRRTRFADGNRQILKPVDDTPIITTAEQAEQLFQEFVADGLSQDLIRRLLAEAGCRQSWLNFRIQRQFGGW